MLYAVIFHICDRRLTNEHMSDCVSFQKGCLTCLDFDFDLFVSDAAVAESMHMDDSTVKEIQAEADKDMAELGLNEDQAAALGNEAKNLFGNLDLVHKEGMLAAGKVGLDEVQAKEAELLLEENEEEAEEDELMAVEDELQFEDDLEAAKEDEKKVFMGGVGDDVKDDDY